MICYNDIFLKREKIKKMQKLKRWNKGNGKIMYFEFNKDM